jgi:epoxyqueuosine reductase
MNVNAMTQELSLQLEKHGYRGKIVPIEHLQELQKDLEGHRRTGALCAEIYQKYFAQLDYRVPTSLPAAKSCIIVATPQPQVKVSFTLNGTVIPLLVPPTYAYAGDVQVKNLIEHLLEPNGYHLEKMMLPLKLLAVRSGLAQYGKNNITYVPGMGSFQRLVAFCTDVPCLEDPWQEPQVMESCQTCSACLKGCPTGAIASDRFLLHAERCLTLHNESTEAFPAWIEASWHHCLIGCLRCQKCCPVNQPVLTWIEEQATFSEDETTLLLQGVSRDSLPVETARKLDDLGILEDVALLPRNLGVLFKRP